MRKSPFYLLPQEQEPTVEVFYEKVRVHFQGSDNFVLEMNLQRAKTLSNKLQKAVAQLEIIQTKKELTR